MPINKKTLWKIGNELVKALQQNCPSDSGMLKISIGIESYGNDQIKIKMKQYGKFVEFGTKPHIIRAKDKPYLVFEIGKKKRLEAKMPKSGAIIVSKKEVHHPGTKPSAFIRNTLRRVLPRILNKYLSG